MQSHISADKATPIRVVIITLDSHLAGAIDRARPALKAALPGLSIALHAAAEWGNDATALERCHEDIAAGDIIIANMLFMEDHIQAVLPQLKARRDHCDAMIGSLSSGEIIRMTRLGNFAMDGSQGGAMALLKRLRGSSKREGAPATSGAQQMAMLRRIPKILRFIPGTAQDVRAYFLTLQYWLSGSQDNVVNMVRYLVDRYADGPRRHLRGTLRAAAPVVYPEVGVYHPRLAGRVSETADDLPSTGKAARGRVGLLIMRSYILAGNSGHYDGVIRALEARGLDVVPAFSAGLDARPAVDAFFKRNAHATVDAIVSLTGFSLVGGPAYNDSKAADDMLAGLDVPYVAAHALEFQTLEQWGASDRGLMPVESTIMVAIPELDGATGPMVYGGRADAAGHACTGCERRCMFKADGGGRDMHSCPERAEMLAARVDRLITLRKSQRAERKIAIVLFNFPPNAGATGSAAFLSVFASLRNTLAGLKAAGYSVDVPESVDAVREQIISGNAQRFGTPANVHTRIPVDRHVRHQRWLKEIEAQWGPAPGRHNSDGQSIFILGASFGNVFVGVQPAFGYEGDPMRLLFEKGFAPTHAFAAFYRYIRDDFGAKAILHFGTHGALEFMPGKQAGLSGACWPDRLIGDMPNLYLYAANNPSEGTIAKRRSAATLVSYLTPPIAHAGLYRGLNDLKVSIERWRALTPDSACDRDGLASLIQAQASAVDLAAADPVWNDQDFDARIAALWSSVLELEYALIPNGLHVVGETMTVDERAEMLMTAGEASHGVKVEPAAGAALAKGATITEALALCQDRSDTRLPNAFAALSEMNRMLSHDYELPALIKALDGDFVRPAPSGDLIRTPNLLPTGRNIHGFDPFRIPSAFAITDGARQTDRLLARHAADGNPMPETVALVLWGTDNLKSEGAPIAQALALLGARPRFDSYGRLCGAALIPLEDLGRPRIDCVVTLSGIFRDLLPLQTKLLAEAAFLAASADEAVEFNFVRKHALDYMARTGTDIETAALRVFSNADGAYGSNVNHMVEAGTWSNEDELAETYTHRKSFAYSRSGKPEQQSTLLNAMLGSVELTYQNLESVEVGITTVDHYFDTLGGISRAVRRATGASVPVYIGDQTRGEGLVRTLSEQVALETRTRVLNPKWYEGMLKHGYEGVRNIEAHVTNTLGWSATTGQVAPWVYQQITQTFVLDEAMRERLAALNPTASAKVANRLLEAHDRRYWKPDASVLAALRQAGADLEDRLEGIGVEAAA
ncbi:MAG: magnesium chelatase subunit H [Hyphomicrobium sp.]